MKDITHTLDQIDAFSRDQGHPVTISSSDLACLFQFASIGRWSALAETAPTPEMRKYAADNHAALLAKVCPAPPGGGPPVPLVHITGLICSGRIRKLLDQP